MRDAKIHGKCVLCAQWSQFNEMSEHNRSVGMNFCLEVPEDSIFVKIDA